MADSIDGDKVAGSKVVVNPPDEDSQVIDHLIYQTRLMTQLERDLRGNGNPGISSRLKTIETVTVYQWVALALFALYDLIREIVNFLSK